jgi:general secretion pathway protein G
MQTMKIRKVKSRRGYTLIELLVVIAIIAVLMGLLMSGVMSVLRAKDRFGNAADIGKLSQSMDVALKKYNSRSTMPGKLVLSNNMSFYANPTAQTITQPNGASVAVSQSDVVASRDALRAMFGPEFMRTSIANGTVVAWDGTSNNNVWVLEGHQCLVFYLGGVPQARSGSTRMLGFRDNSLDPVNGSGDQVGPFYNFESNRLVFVGGSPFPSYLDRYGTPYAYFGGRGGPNTYVSFCPSLPGSPIAYAETSTKWTRPDSFQIISAGKDKVFGQPSGGPSLGTWNPASGSSDPAARDDVSNFSSGPLSNPMN